MSDSNWDDSDSGYSDEAFEDFEEESVEDLSYEGDAKTPANAVPSSEGTLPSVSSSSTTQRGQEQAARKDSLIAGAPIASSSSPKAPLTDRGRGRQESLLNMGGPTASLQNLINRTVASRSSALSIQSWGDSMKEIDEGEEEEEEDNGETEHNARNTDRDRCEPSKSDTGGRQNGSLGAVKSQLQLPEWSAEQFSIEEPDGHHHRETQGSSEGHSRKLPPALSGTEVPRFNRDYADSSQNSEDEYLSPSSSAAVAAIMKRNWSRSSRTSKASEENDNRVLAWLAAQTESSGPICYQANMEDASSQWYINPKLKGPAAMGKRKSSGASNVSALLGMALADDKASPGSVNEGVMELIYECLLDNLRFPRYREERENFLRAAKPEDNHESETFSVARARTATGQAPGNTITKSTFSIPDSVHRPTVETAIEQAYIGMVRRACLEPRTDLKLGSRSGLSHELATRVQKELLSVMSDVMTDPGIVGTIKTACLSRVFAGSPLRSAAWNYSP